MSKSPSPLPAIALGTLIIAAIGFYQFQEYYVDDAYISLRYCRNLIAGNGLVWNPGERVEGYSNFLYIILTSALGSLGIDLVRASQIVSFAAYLGLALFVGRFLQRRLRQDPHGGPFSFIPVVFTLTALPLVIWTWGGLETTLFTMWSTIGIWLFAETLREKTDHRARLAIIGLSLALAAMTRPEGVMLFGIVGLFALWSVIRRRFRFRDLLGMTAIFALIWGGYFLWRYNYYGDLLPNTYYVKSGSSPEILRYGWIYFASFLFVPPFVLPLAVFEGIHLFISRKGRLVHLFLATVVIGYTLYIVRVGGDHMLGYRFFVPVIPIAALFLGESLRSTGASLSRGRGWLFAGLVLALVSLQLGWPGPKIGRARRIDAAAYLGQIIGKHIDTEWPKGSLIALNTAGSTPYFADQRRYIDMLGLVDYHIGHREITVNKTLSWESVPGHEKGDGHYVVSRWPDYIIIGPANGSPIWKPWFRSDIELSGSQDFLRNYRKKVVVIDVSDDPGHEDLRETRKGTVEFIYYERIGDPPDTSGER